MNIPIEISDSALEEWITSVEGMCYYELVTALKELKYRREKEGRLS